MSLYADYLKRFPNLISCLENARSQGRFAHSFLIHSPDEKVRREFVAVLAQIAGCHNSVKGRPDTTCHFCRKIEAGLYTDMHTLTPVGKKYQIRVGDVTNPEPNTLRDMLDHLGYTSGSHRKFGVIEEADRMGQEAQNALLKTLEEPPRETTIILTTANPSSLLPTTRSRCQLISLPDNHCNFDFPWFDAVRKALYDLCFCCANDITATELAARTLIETATALAADAENSLASELEAESAAAIKSEDKALIKRIEARHADAVSGAYMRERRRFIAAISTFCSQIFMISSGISLETLPNPEFFKGLALPGEITPDFGAKVLKEANDLEYTLLFNVNDELALRSFAVNIALR